MSSTEIKTLIQQQLPEIIAQDPLIRDFILRTVSNYYAGKQETDSKFDRILNELQRDREEQSRKWDENNRKWEENNRRLDNFIHEQNQKWEENNRKWDENNRKWDENNLRLDKLIEENNQKWDEQHQLNKQILEDIRRIDRRYESTMGALGARWGLNSEASFRNALKGILENSFGVQVVNLNDFDDEGIVFGRPDQVEIDVIIKNSLVIVCEIKSSIDKAGMYIFSRKVKFYQKRHQRTVNRKLVISPMVDARALPLAEDLGIEVYSYAQDVSNL